MQIKITKIKSKCDIAGFINLFSTLDLFYRGRMLCKKLFNSLKYSEPFPKQCSSFSFLTKLPFTTGPSLLVSSHTHSSADCNCYLKSTYFYLRSPLRCLSLSFCWYLLGSACCFLFCQTYCHKSFDFEFWNRFVLLPIAKFLLVWSNQPCSLVCYRNYLLPQTHTFQRDRHLFQSKYCLSFRVC